MPAIKHVGPAKPPVWICCVNGWRFNNDSLRFRIPERMGMIAPVPKTQHRPKNRFAEQAGTSNGGQRPSLNSGFLPRRGWPIRSQENPS
jgi:hypothetical protein